MPFSSIHKRPFRKIIIAPKILTFLILSLALALANGTAYALSIQDSVWIDSNNNGIRDSGEPPLANAQVKLYFDHNRDGVPERMIDQQRTDSNGNYAFGGHPAGKYQVVIPMADMPDNIYRVTLQNVGTNEASDNDVDSNTLRTDILDLIDPNRNYTNLADIGVEWGSTELVYEGLHPWGDSGLMVQRWSYQNLGLIIDDNGQPVTSEIYDNVGRWVKWYAKADKITQELHQKKNWWQRTRYPDGYGPLHTGRKIFVHSSQNGSFGGGLFASSGTPPDFVWNNPTSLAPHRLMLYEMQRGLQGFWRGRGLWPSNGGFAPNFGIGDIVIISPHLLSAWNTFALGGESAMYDRLEGQWVAGDQIEGLRKWERTSVSFLDAMPGFEAPSTIPLTDPLDGSVDRRHLPFSAILLEIAMAEGMDKLAEMLTNLAQAKIPGSAEQAFIDFYTAVNEATDGRYASKLINDWGLPAGPYTSTRGISSGQNPNLLRYQWDFAPHGVPDSELMAGYRLFSERTFQGFMRFVGDVSTGSFFYDTVAATTQGDHSFVQVPRNSMIEHRVSNGLWTVTMEMTAYYRNPILAEGKPVTPLQNPAEPGDKASFVFKVQVTDGALNIEFVGNPHIFSMVLESDNAAPPEQQPRTEPQPQALASGRFALKNPSAGKCADRPGGIGTDMIRWACHGGGNQQFISRPGNGGFVLQFVNSDLCLDVAGTRLLAWTCHGGDNQVFNWDGAQLRSKASGQCATFTVGSKAVEMANCVNSPAQQLDGGQATSAPEPRVNNAGLKNIASGKCVDIGRASSSNGSNALQWSCHGRSNQQFTQVPGNGGFMLRAAHSGKCLDAWSGNIHQWECHGGANQLFNWDGEQLRLKSSGQCVTVDGASSENGANIQEQSCTNGAAQRFTTN